MKLGKFFCLFERRLNMNSGPKYHRHDHEYKCPVRGLTLLRVNSGTLGPTTFDFFTTPQTITGINQPITSVSINAENLQSPIILIRFLGILTATGVCRCQRSLHFFSHKDFQKHRFSGNPRNLYRGSANCRGWPP